MADVGTLVVRMAADSAQMRSELDRVQKQLKATSSSTVDLAGSFKGLAALAGGFSMLAVVNQALQAAEALQNVSIQTGISTDALQRLEFAAGLSGASLDQVSGAVTKMQKALVTSGEGSKEAQQALERLGISTADLLALQPDKQFERVAVAIAGIDDPAQRATAAISLFGRSGAELLPTLTAVGANAEEINARFSDLGGPISAEAIGAVDELGDSLDGLKSAGKSLGVELVALVAGPLTDALKITNEWIGSLRILAGGGGEIERLQRKLEILQEARDSIPVFLNFGYVDNGGVVLGPKALDGAISRLTKQIADLKAAAAKTTEPVAALPAAPPLAGPAKPAAKVTSSKSATPEQTAAERRAASDKSYLNTINLQAIEAYQLQEQALDQHLANMVAKDSAASLARVKIASDLEMFRADVAQSFGLQQLDFEQIKNQSIIGLAGELFTALGSESSKLFKVQKAFAIANAVVSTATGVAKALELPFPANLAAAAKVAAAGAIQVAKIKATNPGGGSSAPSLGGAGGGGGQAGGIPDQMPAFQQQEPQRIAQVVVQGNLFSARETADWLIEQLSDAVNNRDVVFINGQSRQAGAIAEGA